jgi:hypothetical protein
MSAKTSKYPKSLAKAETTRRKGHEGNEIVTTDGQALALEKLTQAVFNLSGAYPYLFDTISYVATHHQEAIERQDNDKETHYRVRIPIEKFIDMALDEHTSLKSDLWAEMYKLMRSNQPKALPMGDGHTIVTTPIRMDLIMEDGTKGGAENLKNTRAEGARIKFVILEFYKPLWKSLLSGPKGQAWFLIPKALQAKLKTSIMAWKDDQEFSKYGVFGTVLNYRRLYLYLNLHDNSSGSYINYDGIDLAKACIPKNVKASKGKEYLDWYPTHQFMQKGLRLFHRMASNGMMEGVKLIPKSVWYSKPIKNFRVELQRNDYQAIPDFTSQIGSPELDL